MKMLRRDKPLCVGLSPECTLFSALQNLRKTEIDKAELERAVECVRFCVRVADNQRSKGIIFYFEHPLTARSWQSVDELWELMGRDDVEAVTVHMCQFELQATDS